MATGGGVAQRPDFGFTTPASMTQNTWTTAAQGQPADAPKGYVWDPIKKSYVPTVASAQEAEAQLRRQQQQQQSMFNQLQTAYGSAQNMTPMPQAPSVGGGFAGQVPQAPSFSAMPPPQQTQLPAQAQIQYPNLGPAQDAAFNRAKDVQGQTTRSAISGLQSALAGRGMLGSGAESRGIRGIVEQGAGALGNLTREQAIEQAQQAQRAAETAFQGGIAQRGQDIGAQESRQQQALQGWQAQNQAQLGQYGAQLDAYKAQQQAEEARQQMALQAYNANLNAWQANRQAQQGALSGLTSAFRASY